MARELTAIVVLRGRPGAIVSDNGTEFTCNAMLAWCKESLSASRSERLMSILTRGPVISCRGLVRRFVDLVSDVTQRALVTPAWLRLLEN